MPETTQTEEARRLARWEDEAFQSTSIDWDTALDLIHQRNLMLDSLVDALEAVTEERDRLREALERIRTLYAVTDFAVTDEEILAWIENEARHALSEAQGDTQEGT